MADDPHSNIIDTEKAMLPDGHMRITITGTWDQIRAATGQISQALTPPLEVRRRAVARRKDGAREWGRRQLLLQKVRVARILTAAIAAQNTPGKEPE